MPTLSAHPSRKTVKLLYIGDSGTGKTGSLVSLVEAGYKLRILDMDSGLDALINFILKQCPDKIDTVQYYTTRDSIRAAQNGPRVDAKAYVAATKALTKWPDDESIPAEWDEQTVFVLDSTTALGDAALEWARAMNPNAKDPRQWYAAAQQSFTHILSMLTSEDFRPNVVVVAHVKYEDLASGLRKGYPTAVGSALGPLIPRFFNTMVEARTKFRGKEIVRTISTIPTSELDLKNPAPFKIEKEYSLGTGMATLFKTLTSAE